MSAVVSAALVRTFGGCVVVVLDGVDPPVTNGCRRLRGGDGIHDWNIDGGSLEAPSDHVLTKAPTAAVGFRGNRDNDKILGAWLS